LLTVSLGFQVFVTVATRANNHSDDVSTTLFYTESPFAAFNSGNGILLSDSPGSSIAIATSDLRNSLMWIETVTFGDA
jgi:hypothetical protein